MDIGCGTGDNAIFFAKRGERVTGIDFLPGPIQLARENAKKEGVTIDFRVEDALQLSTWTEKFDHLIDSGLFHVFDDTDRIRYVQGLKTVLHSGGKLVLLCFSVEEPGEQGPRRVSIEELGKTFAVSDWAIFSLLHEFSWFTDLIPSGII